MVSVTTFPPPSHTKHAAASQTPRSDWSQAHLRKGLNIGSDFILALEQEGGREGNKIRPETGWNFPVLINRTIRVAEVTMETVTCACLLLIPTWLEADDTSSRPLHWLPPSLATEI